MSGPHTDPESIAELQARLHEAEARLHSLGRNLPGSVLFQSVREPDARRHFAYMGEGIERLTGLTAAQLLADFGAFYRLIDPEDFPAYKASVDHSYHTLETVETQFRIHRTDGELRWIRLSATPRRLGEDRVIWDGLLTDITGQIRAEAAARAYETQLAGVLRHLPGAVARLGLGLEILYVNQTQAQWVDTEADQIIGKRVPEVIAPALMERMAPYFERAIRGETVVFENRIDRPDGEVRFRHTTLVPERTADGSIGSIVLFAYDLTALKNAQAEALQQKALLSSLLKAMPDMVFLKNTQGVYQACNPVFERFMGRSEREILGRTDADLLLPAAAAHFSRCDRQALQAWQPLVIEDTLVFADDGYEGQFETILTPIRDVSGQATGVLGVARDITDRKRAERRIRYANPQAPFPVYFPDEALLIKAEALYGPSGPFSIWAKGNVGPFRLTDEGDEFDVVAQRWKTPPITNLEGGPPGRARGAFVDAWQRLNNDPYHDRELTDLPLVGGKNASLGEMIGSDKETDNSKEAPQRSAKP